MDLEDSPSLKQPLKMDGRNTSFHLGRPIFRGYVSFRECTIWYAYDVYNLTTCSPIISRKSKHVGQSDRQRCAVWS